jgi:hypothetical protein
MKHETGQYPRNAVERGLLGQGHSERDRRMTSASSLVIVASGIGGSRARLPAGEVVLLGLAALAVVAVQEIWMLTRHVNAIAHEGAHAAVGLLAGRKVQSVELKPNGEGLTKLTSGQAAGTVLISVVGYLGPSLFGLGAAKMISLGLSVTVLWLGLVLLVGVLFLLRKVFSYVPVVITGLLLFMIARYAALGTQTVFAYGSTWFLLLAGVRQVLDHGVKAGDAATLAKITHIRGGFWFWLWLAGSVLALVVGGALLV